MNRRSRAELIAAALAATQQRAARLRGAAAGRGHPIVERAVQASLELHERTIRAELKTLDRLIGLLPGPR